MFEALQMCFFYSCEIAKLHSHSFFIFIFWWNRRENEALVVRIKSSCLIKLHKGDMSKCAAENEDMFSSFLFQPALLNDFILLLKHTLKWIETKLGWREQWNYLGAVSWSGNTWRGSLQVIRSNCSRCEMWRTYSSTPGAKFTPA